MYLFDTDVITNIFKKKPSRNLLQRLKVLDHQQQFISTITVYEIIYGACKSNRPDHHLENLETILLPAVNVVGFDIGAAYVCGRLRSELERKGESVPIADLQIAAIALAHELILITGNQKHFKRIPGLQVEDWLQG
ncbi:type II toxin-antitoxin system VapC family toxin [Thermodesulfobacteriota bacterium]